MSMCSAGPDISPGPDLEENPDYDPGTKMPSAFAFRVRTPRGLGVIIRVRKDRKRPFLIKIDTLEKPYWAVIEKVQPIGFSKKTEALKS